MKLLKIPNMPRLVLCLSLASAAFLVGCTEWVAALTGEDGGGSSSKSLRLSDGTIFTVQAVSPGGPDEKAVIRCSLYYENVNYRLGKNGNWRPLYPETFYEEDGEERTQLSSEFFLRPGKYFIQIKVLNSYNESEIFDGPSLVVR